MGAEQITLDCIQDVAKTIQVVGDGAGYTAHIIKEAAHVIKEAPAILVCISCEDQITGKDLMETPDRR